MTISTPGWCSHIVACLCMLRGVESVLYACVRVVRRCLSCVSVHATRCQVNDASSVCVRARRGSSLREKINDDVRRCISPNYRAISCAIDGFPVPACPKRTRQRFESVFGSFTQLIMKPRDATRVPTRQPLSGLNRELTPHGTFSITASGSITTIRSVTHKPLETTYRRLQLGLTGPEAELIYLRCRPEFGTQ
jgi:hypothetical protein